MNLKEHIAAVRELVGSFDGLPAVGRAHLDRHLQSIDQLVAEVEFSLNIVSTELEKQPVLIDELLQRKKNKGKKKTKKAKKRKLDFYSEKTSRYDLVDFSQQKKKAKKEKNRLLRTDFAKATKKETKAEKRRKALAKVAR